MRYDDLWRSIAPLYDAGEARAVVRLVLETRFGMSSTDVYCGGVERLSDSDAAALETIMIRLREGEPVQYVLGEADFCGRTYRVAPGVLIPRPETEDLCEWIVQRMAERKTAESDGTDARPDILDICTGSGCIAITLALDVASSRVEAWDISEDALAMARENGERLGTAVDFRLQDALRAPTDHGRWDIIVSNPPYVCERERAEMDAHVLDHEPSLALFVPDDDPLKFYRAIARYASDALKRGGSLFFEINALYSKETADVLREEGFCDVEVRDDRFGRPRFVCGTKADKQLKRPL